MAGYPTEYELDVVLRDGSVTRIRPIRPEDADQARAFFEKLGPESRYFRFFNVKQTLTDEEVADFSEVDYHDRMALVAVDDDEVVAVGRYDREEPGGNTAEVAFSVVDDHQGRGIGTRLLELLTNP